MTVYVALDYDGVAHGIFSSREFARRYALSDEGQSEWAVRVAACLLDEVGGCPGDVHSIERVDAVTSEWRWETMEEVGA